MTTFNPSCGRRKDAYYNDNSDEEYDNYDSDEDYNNSDSDDY